MRKSASGTASGKVILFGEHAVVYGQPAIAVPVQQLQATATVESASPGEGLTLIAKDLATVIPLEQAPEDDPLAVIVWLTLAHLNVAVPDATLTLSSTIPIASGLGSGTAVSTAIVRALSSYLDRDLDAGTVSRLVYEVEKLHHGTPSGVDNTVIAYGTPVFFAKGQPIETFEVGAALDFVIGDSGVVSSTRVAVRHVRRGWEAQPDWYEDLFGQIGDVVREARTQIETGGDKARLGELMDRNQELLHALGVSSSELECLVSAARTAGALGAKLSGAGRGGNMIALVGPETADRVSAALCQTGAVRAIRMVLPASTTARGS